MFSFIDAELVFTFSACFSLLSLWVAGALVLPWTEQEMDEVEEELERMIHPTVLHAAPLISG